MLKLFAVLLGGRAPGCNIELHDVVFVVGETLEETYPMLVNKWFGKNVKGLHIDSSVELKYVGGYEIVISKQRPDDTENKLFFINFGGYQPGYFGEVHAANFYIAASQNEAIHKAKRELCLTTEQQHCDDKLIVDDLLNAKSNVDDIIVLNHVDQYYVHLKTTAVPPILTIESRYLRLDRPDILERAEQLKAAV